MKKVQYYLEVFVFLAATLAIAGVFYEGMELKWFNIVGTFIMLMDFSFILSTIVNLILERNSKWIGVHIFSLVAIIVAIAMKLLHIEYPTITLVIWYFYIWFLYDIRLIRNKK